MVQIIKIMSGKGGNIFDAQNLQLKRIGTLAGIITVVVVAFYATGAYRNILEIRDIKRQEKA